MSRPFFSVRKKVVFLALSQLLAGCAQVLGVDGDPPSEIQIDAAPVVDAPPPPDARLFLECSESKIEPQLGQVALNTENAGDQFTLACAEGSAGERVFTWVAPTTDYFVFDTFGSSFDTVLGLVDGCEGAELGCSNNANEEGHSEIVKKIEVGQELAIVVDGANGDRGDALLNIDRVSCPDTDLEGQTFPLTRSTLGFGDEHANACGGKGAEDRAYHWVVPEDGLWSFRASSDSFRPSISLVDGPRCEDKELACNASVTAGGFAEVGRVLKAGQSVSIHVDGSFKGEAGSFLLDVSKRGEGCEIEELGDFPVEYREWQLGSSCAIPVIPTLAGPMPAAERLFHFVALGTEPACSRSCEITVLGSGPVAVAAVSGADCSGEEIACSPPSGGNNSGSVVVSSRSDNVDTIYTIIVTDQSGISGANFSVVTQCNEACS